MGLLVGPTPWWQSNLVAACPEGSFLPDGSTIICKSGGTAWIVAPSCTQVSSSWNGSSVAGTGDKPNISSWATLCNQLLSCGFNPSDWFVPSLSQLQNPGYVCRTNWDSFSATCYWTSTEYLSLEFARTIDMSNGVVGAPKKCSTLCVRAFRCVTY